MGKVLFHSQLLLSPFPFLIYFRLKLKRHYLFQLQTFQFSTCVLNICCGRSSILTVLLLSSQINSAVTEALLVGQKEKEYCEVIYWSQLQISSYRWRDFYEANSVPITTSYIHWLEQYFQEDNSHYFLFIKYTYNRKLWCPGGMNTFLFKKERWRKM